MNILSQFLVSLLTTGSILYALSKFWLKERIRVEVEEASSKRVRAFQLEVDKAFEDYKARLTNMNEALRSDLSKSGTDYAIYAQRRHAAIALVYSELLEAEFLVGSSIKKPYFGRGEKRDLNETVGQAVNKARESYFANALYLTAGLDEQAYEIGNLIDEIAQENLFPGEKSQQLKGAKLRELRQSLNSFLINAREELSQGRPTR